MYQKLNAPVSCQVEITTVCNLNCFHCYNYWRHGDQLNDFRMTNDVIDKIVSQLIDLKVFHVTITGGEPFSNKEVMFRAIEKLVSNGIVCDVNTNLTLITPETATRLVSLGVGGVLASFASADQKKHDQIMQKDDAFKRLVKGIEIAQNSGLSVAASIVVTKLNMDSVFETGKFLKSIGVNQFYATKASPPVNSAGFKKYLLSKEELIGLLDTLAVLKNEHGMDIGALECYPPMFVS